MFQTSGLSAVIGKSMGIFGTLPEPLIVLILVLIGTLFTTFTSNVSTTTILLPITSELVSYHFVITVLIHYSSNNITVYLPGKFWKVFLKAWKVGNA